LIHDLKIHILYGWQLQNEFLNGRVAPMEKLRELASLLEMARVTKAPVPHLTKSNPNLSINDAYTIQKMGTEIRMQKFSDRLIGYKMGLTSEAKRKQMNLHSPLYGTLLASMQIKNSGTFDKSQCIHPKTEPEMAFLINRTLKGPQSYESVVNSIEAACWALEILDSRYDQFQYFSLVDVIADNSSSSHFVLGPWQKNWAEVELKPLALKLLCQDELVERATAAHISGDPILSVVQLTSLLSEQGLELPAGAIVLAGAATAAKALENGKNYAVSGDHFEGAKFYVGNETNG
jgi:2-oxo-3-hexenedioate decarboxylase